MAYYNVFIKELRRRHPNVLILSYVDGILVVAQDLKGGVGLVHSTIALCLKSSIAIPLM